MKIDHKYFNIILGVISVSIVGFLINTGNVGLDSILGMVGSTFFNVSLFLSFAFGLQFFLKNIKLNILEEIFDEKNTAAAIYMLGIFISLAIIISKAF